MIFTIQAQEMFLEIDLSSLVLTINSIETQINSSKRKTEFGVKKYYSVKNIGWLNINLKLVGIFTLIVGLFGLGIVNAFAYLGM